MAGLEPVRFEPLGVTRRLDLHRVPVSDEAELEEWMEETLGIKAADVRWKAVRRQGTGDTLASIVFTTDVAKNRALERFAAWMERGHGDAERPSVRVSDRESFSTSFALTTPVNVTEAKVRQLLGANGQLTCATRVKEVKPAYQVLIYSFQRDKAFLLGCFAYDKKPQSIELVQPKQHMAMNGRQSPTGGVMAVLTFTDRQIRDEALMRLPQIVSSEQCMINTVNPKTGMVTQRPSRARVGPGKRDTDGTAVFKLIARDRAAAQAVATTPLDPGWVLKAQAKVTVKYAHVYPELQVVADRIAAKYSITARMVMIKQKDDTPGPAVVFLEGSSGDDVGAAAASLSTIVTPVQITGNTDKERAISGEIVRERVLDQWSRELGFAWEQGKFGRIYVYGPRQVYGQLLRKLLEYEVSFRNRYSFIMLNDGTNMLFRKGRAGHAKLAQLQRDYSGRCAVEHRNNLGGIHLLATPDAGVQALQAAVKNIVGLVVSLGGQLPSTESLMCVFCGSQGGAKRAAHTLSVCGHRHCGCISQLAQSHVTLPIQCGRCNTPVASRDVQAVLDGQSFQQLCQAVTQAALLHDIDAAKLSIVACPVPSCGGLLSRAAAYGRCDLCLHQVCGLCGAVDDTFHVDASCGEAGRAKAEYEQRLAKEERERLEREARAKREAERQLRAFHPKVRQIVKASQAFLEAEWPADIDPISRRDVNSGLEVNCPALQRFLNAVKDLGLEHLDDLQPHGFFTWHGTSKTALPLICHEGFDPSKRSGQAYGPGEYFGCDASVSVGYSGGHKRMIVAFVVRAPNRITTKAGFCHVVNNPKDWRTSYCLPVLVASYGPTDPPEFISTPSPNPDLGEQEDPVGGELSHMEVPWQAPFRWHWQQDGGKMEPYRDDVNEQLERLRDAWQHAGGASRVRTDPIIRYMDDQPQVYEIDFIGLQQRNIKSGYVRRVERRQGPPAGTSHWQYKDEHDAYQFYDSYIQARIEAAFQQYLANQGQRCVQIRFPGRPETYEINFALGTQRNTITNNERPIQRV